MPEKIQRVPRGLIDLLSISGGQTPQQLGDSVLPMLELLQFYAQTQLQTQSVANAALAEAGSVDIDVPVTQWWVLLAAHIVVVKTATVTALRGSISIGKTVGGQFGTIHADELGPFGATETGIITSPAPIFYPRLLMPGTRLRATLEVLGTDATANFGLTAQVGVLG